MNKKVFDLIINLLRDEKITTEEFELIYNELSRNSNLNEVLKKTPYDNLGCKNKICFCDGSCLKNKPLVPDWTYRPETMPFYTTITCTNLKDE